MIDPQVAYDKLAQFENAGDLREYFQSEQIIGIRGNASQCPIAKWLGQTTQWSGLVTVSEKIKFFPGPAVESGADIDFPITDAAREFVDAFDLGFYPELCA